MFNLQFSDLPGFIFRFPGKSGTAGSYTIFGATVGVKIPMMMLADETDIAKGGTMRETVTLALIETNQGGVLPAVAGGATTSSSSAVFGVGSDSHDASSLRDSTYANAAGTNSTGNSASHVIYVVETTHGKDTWQVTRR
jgi:hypothetical protein